MPRATDPGRPRPWLAALRTKVARRVVLLFFVCAVVPMALVGVVSYAYVGRQLTGEAEDRVERGAKLSGQAVIESLRSVEIALRLAAHLVADRGADVAPESLSVGGARALVWARPDGVRTLVGTGFPLPDLEPEMRERLRAGGSVVRAGTMEAGEPALLMVHGVAANESVLWALIDPAHLAESTADAAVCLFDQERTIACELPGADRLRAGLIEAFAGRRADDPLAPPRVFRWEDPVGADYVVGYWEVFLRPSFLSGSWYIAVAESRAAVLQPLARFNRTFPYMLLLALWIVLLFSNVQIRRSLEPLTRLTAGTRRVARRDFSEPVVIRSGDEFEELAGSFNAMAQRLDRQFRALEARSEIDRAVLAVLDVDRIAATVVDEAPRAVGSDGVGIALAPADGPAPWHVTGRAGTAPPTSRLQTVDPREVEELERDPGPRWVADGSIPSYVPEPLTPGMGLLILPLLLDRRAAGALVLGFQGRTPTDEELVAARQMADQVTVALANTRLLARLDRMNWGTVEALARAIDAKSPWTAGHSERVTALALGIGRRLGLERTSLDDLHRGALLHDVGKIGVPNEILDKAGPLTPEERELMRRHVRIGAAILAPIPAYAGTLPVVLHHHEWWDGSGYPDGLRGEAIPLLARILALPDTYDALTSDRPYRSGLAPAEAVQRIRDCQSVQFDPDVTRAFLAVIAEREPGSAAGVSSG